MPRPADVVAIKEVVDAAVVRCRGAAYRFLLSWVMLGLASTGVADALDFGARVQPDFALPLSSPQSQQFSYGGGGSLKLFLGLGRFVDAQIGFSDLTLAAGSEKSSSVGSAWADSAGFRLQRPRDTKIGERGVLSPWIDADALYVRTGSLDRFGFTAGAGLAVALTQAHNLWLGPFVRYMQIVQPSTPGYVDTDAKILLVGVSFEVGTGHELPTPVAPKVAAAEAAPPAPVPPADRDHDGVIDSADHCPDLAGAPENGGCPLPKPDHEQGRTYMSDRILFAWGQADLMPETREYLDGIAELLKRDPSIFVVLEGHTDASGGESFNYELSAQRAQAVLGYLIEHGVSKDRLTIKGQGSSIPRESNDTAAGRRQNRRVEFVIQFMHDGGSGK